MSSKITDLSRLCIHTITTKPWSIEESAERYANAGVKGISVWRQYLEGRDIVKTGDMLRAHGLEVVSLVAGAFFRPSTQSSARRPLRRTGKFWKRLRRSVRLWSYWFAAPIQASHWRPPAIRSGPALNRCCRWQNR